MESSPTVSRLAAVKRGRLGSPPRVLVYGPEGVGKTTLAVSAPVPILIDVEDGAEELDVARYSFRDGAGGHIPQTFAEVMGAIEDLRRNPHEYRTLVLDSVDRIEALIFAHVVEAYSGRKDESLNKSGRRLLSVESFGFGKGFSVALDEWRRLCSALDDLRRAREMMIILVGHTTIKTFRNPEGEDFDRYQPRLHEKAAGWLKEWASIVGFFAYEQAASKLHESDDGDRPRGFSTGRRLFHTTRCAAYDAKTRIHLPTPIAIERDEPWAPLGAAIEQGRNTSTDDLVALIAAECVRIGSPEITERVGVAVGKATAAKDTAHLSRIVNDLQRRDAAQKESAA